MSVMPVLLEKQGFVSSKPAQTACGQIASQKQTNKNKTGDKEHV